MRIGGTFGRVGRRGWLPTVLAVLAVLVQALIPVAATAYESSGRTVEICTIDGSKTITVGKDGQPQKGFAGFQCHACVMASIAATTPDALTELPVRYAVAEHAVRAEPRALRPQPRAPPRPPSQAPPHTLDV